MEATRKVGLYESMVKRPGGVVYKLAGIEALFITFNFEGGAGNALNPAYHKKFKTFEDREAYIEKFFDVKEALLSYATKHEQFRN